MPLSQTRPFLVKDQKFLVPRRSIFNRVVADNDFERDFAAFLDGCGDIVSFARNSRSTRFRIEYRNAEGTIANYFLDFLVKESEDQIWVIETKGREDLDDSAKGERLQQWCADATALGAAQRYDALFVRQEIWENTGRRRFGNWLRSPAAERGTEVGACFCGHASARGVRLIPSPEYRHPVPIATSYNARDLGEVAGVSIPPRRWCGQRIRIDGIVNR